MSGLDIDKEHIIEMACIVTDHNLEIVAEVKYRSRHSSVVWYNKVLLLLRHALNNFLWYQTVIFYSHFDLTSKTDSSLRPPLSVLRVVLLMELHCHTMANHHVQII